jgi:cell fate (sporulation/competence/biofilm development) regulator YlbF (YheA/YmcA/DUF963 family)
MDGGRNKRLSPHSRSIPHLARPFPGPQVIPIRNGGIPAAPGMKVTGTPLFPAPTHLKIPRLAFAFPQWLCFIVRLKILFMATQIETKTLELCSTILEHLEANGVRKRIDTFLADTDARGQYEKLMNQGQALQEKQQNGHTLAPAEIYEFEKGRDALLKNPVASAFLDAQEEMNNLQHNVQKHINKTFELGRIPTTADLENACGTCGCHEH